MTPFELVLWALAGGLSAVLLGGGVGIAVMLVKQGLTQKPKADQ